MTDKKTATEIMMKNVEDSWYRNVKTLLDEDYINHFENGFEIDVKKIVDKEMSYVQQVTLLAYLKDKLENDQH